MVPSDKDMSFRVQAFQDEQIADGFDGVVAPVDVVSQKDTLASGWNCFSLCLLTYLTILRKS